MGRGVSIPLAQDMKTPLIDITAVWPKKESQRSLPDLLFFCKSFFFHSLETASLMQEIILSLACARSIARTSYGCMIISQPGTITPTPEIFGGLQGTLNTQFQSSFVSGVEAWRDFRESINVRGKEELSWCKVWIHTRRTIIDVNSQDQVWEN